MPRSRLWRLFSDLDLSEARKTEFSSLHDCFTRELKDGARPVDPDPDVLVSPCDAIVGASGGSPAPSCSRSRAFPTGWRICWARSGLVERHRDGRYVTLRLTASMYHRFHAPHDCRVERVTYISGDTWNVNPIALRRIETAVLQERARRDRDAACRPAICSRWCRSPRSWWRASGCIASGAAEPAYRGANVLPCAADYRKGDEMGWFEHGSTIVMLAPESLVLRRQCPARQYHPPGAAVDAFRPGIGHPIDGPAVKPRRGLHPACLLCMSSATWTKPA